MHTIYMDIVLMFGSIWWRERRLEWFWRIHCNGEILLLIPREHSDQYAELV